VVQAGELIAEIDPIDLQVALAQAKAELEQARANADTALRERRRGDSLIRANAIPRTEFDRRVNASAVAAANVELAKAKVAQAELNLSYTRIVAPTVGVIGKKSVAVGDHVAPGQELMAIAQVKGVWITANFRETQLRRIRPGQSAEVHVDALGTKLRGRVTSLGGATGSRFSVFPPENATGNYVKVVQRVPVRIELAQGQAGIDRLRPGMSVEPRVRVR
jgi:membrane fusion protein (multidrug efflux system)